MCSPFHAHVDFKGFAALVAASGHSVLLTGETGSGKTHLARSIHASGPRAARPFVRVNCAAIPDSLFEREMFGHVRGAFTDAREAADGFLAAADGGTLFLDEISELALQNQPKLLLALEEGSFRSLGSTRERNVDVQVIAAANRDLDEMVRRREFRDDLYYRLAVFCYRVPPLRERTAEIPDLAARLLARASGAAAVAAIGDETLRLLMRYDWPGNIRELENVLRAAAVFAEGGEIGPEHLPEAIRRPEARRHRAGGASSPRPRYTAPSDPEAEQRMISATLTRCSGSRSRAAAALGMSRSTLWAKLQRYGTEEESAPGNVGEALPPRRASAITLVT